MNKEDIPNDVRWMARNQLEDEVVKNRRLIALLMQANERPEEMALSKEKGYACKIILDSTNPTGSRLTTFELTFPRIVLAEVNTHRMLSRNSASSRAIPVEKMLQRVTEDPFLPTHWGKNQKGMQAEEDVGPETANVAEALWLAGRDKSITTVKALLDIGIHKQLTNRLIEPWMWHTAIVSATEVDNLFNLRNNKDAQPEFRDVMAETQELYNKSIPHYVPGSFWHLPLVTGVDDALLRQSGFTEMEQVYISAGRCCRVSYLTHEGVRDPKADIDLCHKLIKNGHMSPTEHQAMSLTHDEWHRLAATQANKWIRERIPVGNFWGWDQFRKRLENEHCFPGGEK